MAIDNVREWSYSCIIVGWCRYESAGLHLGIIVLTNQENGGDMARIRLLTEEEV